MSYQPPARPSPALQTVLTWVRAFNTWDLALVRSTMADNHMHYLLPTSVGAQPMTREQYLAFLSGDNRSLKQLFKDFKVGYFIQTCQIANIRDCIRVFFPVSIRSFFRLPRALRTRTKTFPL